MNFSVLILTLNEEKNLKACLESVKWCDDIVVLDSFSTDRTKQIAEDLGARVFERKFDDFASQRNHALRNIPYKHQWLFHLDADERFTPELYQECLEAAGSSDHDGYLVPAKIYFMNQWIRHSTDYPVYQTRFVRPSTFEYEQSGHGQREKPGMKIGKMKNSYLHYPVSHGISDWVKKHDRYSTDEAVAGLAKSNGRAARLLDLFHRDALVRRRSLKALSAGLPFRPAIRFIYQYFFKLGFLDGYPGFCYCRMLGMYELMTALKRKELR